MSMPKDYRHRKINGSILSFSIKTIDLFDNLFIYPYTQLLANYIYDLTESLLVEKIVFLYLSD